MLLHCRWCGFPEILEEALYCRDCGKPYISIKDPAPTFYGAKTFSFAVSNHHIENVTVESVVEDQKTKILGALTMDAKTIHPEETARITMRFDKLPRFLESGSEAKTFPFTVRVASMNNIVEIEKAIQVTFYPIPEVAVNQEHPNVMFQANQLIVEYTPAAPLQIEIPLIVKNSPVEIEYATICNHRVNPTAAMAQVFLPQDKAKNIARFDLETVPELMRLIQGTEDWHGEISIKFKNLNSPLDIKAIFRQLPSPILFLYYNRWTQKGFTENIEVRLHKGQRLDFHGHRSMPFEKRMIIGTQMVDNEFSRHPAKIQVMDITSPQNEARLHLIPDIFPTTIERGALREIQLEAERGTEDIRTQFNFCIFHRTRDEKQQQIMQITLHRQPVKAYPEFLGLDFGTSNSCLAYGPPYFDDDQWEVLQGPLQVKTICLDIISRENDPAVIPTLLLPAERCIEKRIGLATQASNSPPKQLLKRKLLSNKDTTETQRHIELFLQTLFERYAWSMLDQGIPFVQPVNINMAVPTSYAYEQEALRQCCINALKTCGIQAPRVDIIDESLAVLAYFAAHAAGTANGKAHLHADYFWVIDFGGGTTDVTVVRNDGGRFIPCVAGGNPELGGQNINEWIMAAFKEKGHTIDNGTAEVIKLQMEKPEIVETIRRYSNASLCKNELLEIITTRLKEEFRVVVADIFADLPLHWEKEEKDEISLLVLLAGGASGFIGYADLIMGLIKSRSAQTKCAKKITITDVIHINEPKKAVSLGACIQKNMSNIAITMGQNVSGFRLLFLLPQDAKTDLPRVKARIFSPDTDSSTPEYDFAVILDRNQPIPTPREKMRPLSFRNNLGLVRQDPVPLKFFAQVGSGPARPYRLTLPNDRQSLNVDERFVVYFDREHQLRIQLH